MKEIAEIRAQSEVSRALAISNGDKTYVSASSCKRCGSNVKYISSYGCHPCNVEKGLRNLANNTLMGPYRTRSLTNAKTYRYRSRKRRVADPTADKSKIRAIYEESARLTRETGIVHHVDHIVPLSKGGLHHQDNLQVLTWLENVKKGNKL